MLMPIDTTDLAAALADAEGMTREEALHEVMWSLEDTEEE